MYCAALVFLLCVLAFVVMCELQLSTHADRHCVPSSSCENYLAASLSVVPELLRKCLRGPVAALQHSQLGFPCLPARSRFRSTGLACCRGRAPLSGTMGRLFAPASSSAAKTPSKGDAGSRELHTPLARNVPKCKKTASAAQDAHAEINRSAFITLTPPPERAPAPF